jgi:deoxyribodipyrimidine photolyase-related protein
VTQRAALLVLGNQLFPLSAIEASGARLVIMIEDYFLCQHFAYHQQKLVLILASMRAHARQLEAAGLRVWYHRLDDDNPACAAKGVSPETFGTILGQAVDCLAVDELVHFEIEGKATENRIDRWSKTHGVTRRTLPSPMFLCSRSEFASFLSRNRKPQMANFYKTQRRRLQVLVDADGAPVGGRWSFDEENRKKLPKSVMPPSIPWLDEAFDDSVSDVIALVTQRFPSHPGRAEDFAWPASRAQALVWLDDFLARRLELFGPYEDAISSRSDTLFHSVLSPLMNIGLLTPLEILERTLQAAQQREIPLQSLEGFTRQIIGWREFIRGIHQQFSKEQSQGNFWQHHRRLAPSWYSGQTGLAPLDTAIEEAQRRGWSHHIPRLMVVGNLMTLCEIEPVHAHRWFMEMYVDSASWVMGPNVYGMGIFSDGGIFATKPYICGSNYILKMSDHKRGPWCDVMDGLYWRFIDKNRSFFAQNPRLALMPRALDRLSDIRRQTIFAAAEEFLARHTLG